MATMKANTCWNTDDRKAKIKEKEYVSYNTQIYEILLFENSSEFYLSL